MYLHRVLRLMYLLLVYALIINSYELARFLGVCIWHRVLTLMYLLLVYALIINSYELARFLGVCIWHRVLTLMYLLLVYAIVISSYELAFFFFFFFWVCILHRVLRLVYLLLVYSYMRYLSNSYELARFLWVHVCIWHRLISCFRCENVFPFVNRSSFG